MFFRQFHIVQCVSSGEFLCSPSTHTGFFTSRINEAGQFANLSDAIDTAYNELMDDFQVFSFYKQIDLSALPCGVATLVAPPK